MGPVGWANKRKEKKRKEDDCEPAKPEKAAVDTSTISKNLLAVRKDLTGQPPS